MFSTFLTTFFSNGYGQETPNWELPFKKCWEIPTNLSLSENIASDNEFNTIVSFDDNSLLTVNPKNGREIWRAELGGHLGLKPISDKKDIFLVINTGSNNNNKKISWLRSLSLNTGITNWQIEIDTTKKIEGYLYSQYLFIVSDSKVVLAIDKANGKELWSKSFSSEIGSFIVSDPEEILVSTHDKISRLTIKDGTIRQQWTISYSETLKLLNTKNNRIIWGNSSGEIFYFDLVNNNIIWKTRTGGRISSLIETDKGLLATSFDNFIYLFSNKNGNLIWKKRLAGRINIEPLIIMDHIIIVNSGDNIASILDLKSGKTINRISINTDDSFSGPPSIWKNLIIFQTTKGIRAFSNSDSGC